MKNHIHNTFADLFPYDNNLNKVRVAQWWRSKRKEIKSPQIDF